MQSGKREGGDFVAMWVTPRGEWVYCLGEDGILYCFGAAAGKLEHLLQVRAASLWCLVSWKHHPSRLVFSSTGNKIHGVQTMRQVVLAAHHYRHVMCICLSRVQMRGCA